MRTRFFLALGFAVGFGVACAIPDVDFVGAACDPNRNGSCGGGNALTCDAVTNRCVLADGGVGGGAGGSTGGATGGGAGGATDAGTGGATGGGTGGATGGGTGGVSAGGGTGGTATGGGTGGAATGGGTGGGPVTCTAPESACVDGGVTYCTNRDTDFFNCGTCGTACAIGGTCSSGTCTCPGGVNGQVCSGTCVDISNDPTHCGSCATSCVVAQEDCLLSQCKRKGETCSNPITGINVSSTSGVVGFTGKSTAGFTNEIPLCGGNSMQGADVVYAVSVLPSVGLNLIVTVTPDANSDVAVAVFSGGACGGSASCLSYANAAPTGGVETISLDTSIVGTSCYVVVESASTGNTAAYGITFKVQ